VSSVLRPHQHSIGYTGDGFYRSKDPTNSIKVLKEDLLKTKKTTKTTKYIYTQWSFLLRTMQLFRTAVPFANETTIFGISFPKEVSPLVHYTYPTCRQHRSTQYTWLC